MMYEYEEDYESLADQYLDPNSLMSKKMRIVDSHISMGNSLLDIGMGTWELIEREKHKFKKVYGIDTNSESIRLCHRRFQGEEKVILLQCGIDELEDYFEFEQFDHITCLDVLEHLELRDSKKALHTIASFLRDNGRFIFTGPGLFEKIKIYLGRSPHVHSHSSYGWRRMSTEAGLSVTSTETVEFPIIRSDFLRKAFHLSGKCCLMVAYKPPLKGGYA